MDSTDSPGRKVCKIVALESFFCPIPAFEAERELDVAVYRQTARDDVKTLHERIVDAEILITTAYPLTSTTLSAEVTPQLAAVMVMASGTDSVDLDACRRRGIRVFNCANANADAVAEHALGLYFAARRKVVELHRLTVRDEWVTQGTLLNCLKDKNGAAPLALRDEKVGIIGYGAVGESTLCLVVKH